jgi:7-cyano-7-deazaguanine synthase
MQRTVIIHSGGMDSTVLLAHLLAEGREVHALSVDYGQRHRRELVAAAEICAHYKVPHRIADLRGLTPLFGANALTDSHIDVPEGHYAEENQRQTVVPNRNKMFASIVQAIALSVADRTGETCDIALGIHSGDHSVYPDTTEEFRQADTHAFKIGNWGSENVGFFTPYMEGDKFTILQDGETLCSDLGLEFNEVYKRTNTSYKPYPSGNSDYKSASSVERIEAFIKLGKPDPVQYEDETGEVSWEVARAHAEHILSTHNA